MSKRCFFSPLWKLALSITIMLLGGNFGIKSALTQEVNILVFTVPDNNITVSRALPIIAPIAFVRPLAP
jgi:hypothetical protein